MAVSSKSEAT